MDATYVKAAADNMLLALGISSLSNNFNFFNSFKALLEALNSTGKVINWKLIGQVTKLYLFPLICMRRLLLLQWQDNQVLYIN